MQSKESDKIKMEIHSTVAATDLRSEQFPEVLALAPELS